MRISDDDLTVILADELVENVSPTKIRKLALDLRDARAENAVLKAHLTAERDKPFSLANYFEEREKRQMAEEKDMERAMAEHDHKISFNE